VLRRLKGHSMFTINDKSMHSLSPNARLVVKRARPQTVGKRLVLARVKAILCNSGLSVSSMSELSKTRTGRKRITDLVYRAVKAHYITMGYCVSYAVKRAKTARKNMKKELRRDGDYMLIRDRYTDIKNGAPIKDTTNPTDSFYTEKAQGRISAITPIATLIEGLPHNRKPKHIQKQKPQPLAVTENGFIYAGDSEANKVRSILKK